MEEEATQDRSEDTTSRKPVLDRERQDTLIRLLFMILFGVAYRILEFVFAVFVVVQFLFALIRRERNPRLTTLTERLVAYMAQIWDFLAFHTERKPFPFSDWPAGRWDAGDAEREGEVLTGQEPHHSHS